MRDKGGEKNKIKMDVFLKTVKIIKIGISITEILTKVTKWKVLERSISFKFTLGIFFTTRNESFI